MEAPMTLGEFDRRLADMVDRHGNTDRDLETYLGHTPGAPAPRGGQVN